MKHLLVVTKTCYMCFTIFVEYCWKAVLRVFEIDVHVDFEIVIDCFVIVRSYRDFLKLATKYI